MSVKLSRAPSISVDIFPKLRESRMQNSNGDLQETPFAELLSLARSGDSDAIGKLCELCQKYLLLIANNDLSPQMLQKFGASDVVQQSLMIANNKIEGFEGSTKGEFLAWMRQILIHECQQTTRKFSKTAKRAVGRERTIANESGVFNGIQISDPHQTPSTQAVADEQMRLLQIALDRMDPIDRRVIEMRNWEELSFNEIGRSVDKSAEATRKIWSRAIIKLEIELKNLNAI